MLSDTIAAVVAGTQRLPEGLFLYDDQTDSLVPDDSMVRVFLNPQSRGGDFSSILVHLGEFNYRFIQSDFLTGPEEKAHDSILNQRDWIPALHDNYLVRQVEMQLEHFQLRRYLREHLPF